MKRRWSLFLPILAAVVVVLAADVAVLAAPPATEGFRLEVLVSDGTLPSDKADTELVNVFGIATGPTGPWWVAVNEMELAKVYDGEGTLLPPRVTIDGRPTGIVFNGGPAFVITDGASSGAARFLLATENGTIVGWSPAVPPPSPSAQSFVAVDRSMEGTVYTGLALATTASGERLYATDFSNGKIDVFDGDFNPVVLGGTFVDPKLPDGYAPFGIHALSGKIFVTYAMRGEDETFGLPGQGLGIVNVFDMEGRMLARIAQHGQLNAPYGLAIAPDGFGSLSGDLLVSNTGDGEIVVFELSDDLLRGTPKGVLRDESRRPIVIDGLRGIGFGNGAESGPANALYFAAGPAGETGGAFGRILPSALVP